MSDILNINSFLALVIRKTRERLNKAIKEQSVGTYKGVDANSKPQYEINGKTLTGNFSFNAGVPRGSVILGDTEEYIAAQAVIKRQEFPEEVIDPEFHKDFFMISRPDGSTGILRIRTPRKDAQQEVIDGGPAIDIAVLTFPFTQGGKLLNQYNADINSRMFSGNYQAAYISTREKVAFQYQFTGGSINKFYTNDIRIPPNEAITNDFSPATTGDFYAVSPNNTGIYIGAGFMENVYRNGYKIVVDEANGLPKAHMDVNTFQYNYVAQYEHLFTEDDPNFLVPRFEQIVTGGVHDYTSIYAVKETGYHKGKIQATEPLYNYDEIVLTMSVNGTKFTTNAGVKSTRDSTGSGLTPSLFNFSGGNGLWDIPAQTLTNCFLGPTTQRDVWISAGFSTKRETNNIYTGAAFREDLGGSYAGAYSVFYDRDTDPLSLDYGDWNETGMIYQTVVWNSAFGGYKDNWGSFDPTLSGGSFPGCYEGIANYLIEYNSDGVIHNEGLYPVGPLFACPPDTVNNPDGTTTDIYRHEKSSGFNKLWSINPTSVSGTHNILSSCGYPYLIDQAHDIDIFIKLEAHRWFEYTKPFYRHVFPQKGGFNNSAQDVRFMTPSYFGTAMCEIIHPNEYLFPNSILPLSLWDIDDTVFPPVETQLSSNVFSSLGYIEQYYTGLGLVQNGIVATDANVQLLGDWSYYETGYQIRKEIPPLLRITAFIGNTKQTLYALAYEEDRHYFWPKVAVKLHGEEYWLGHRDNKNKNLEWYQQSAARFETEDAEGNPLNLAAPEEVEEYPAIWTDWSNPQAQTFLNNSTFIYSVKETDPYYDPEKGPDEQDQFDDKWCEWTTIEELPIEPPNYVVSYKIKFWYGTVEQFLSNPTGQGVSYESLNGVPSSKLFDRNNKLILLQEVDTANRQNITYYSDRYGFSFVVTQCQSGGGTGIEENIGKQFIYDIFSNSIIAFDFEKSTRKDRPIPLIAGINQYNTIQLGYPSPQSGHLGQNGMVFFEFDTTITATMSVNDISTYNKGSFTGGMQFGIHEYCLTSIQRDLRGLADSYFNKNVARGLPAGGYTTFKRSNPSTSVFQL